MKDFATFAQQFVKYLGASAAALCIDMTAFKFLIPIAKTMPAAVIGYTAGLLVNFVLSSTYVFKNQQNKSVPRLVSEFFVSGIMGLFLTAAVIGVLTAMGASPIEAKISAVAVSFIAIFAVRRVFIFGKKSIEEFVLEEPYP